MSEENRLVYGLDYQARCLTSVLAEQDRCKFMVGTQSLKQDNQLCVLTIDDDCLQMSKTVYPHPAGEFWHLSTSPMNASHVASCYSQLKDGKLRPGCTVWEIDVANQSLNAVADFEPSDDAAAPVHISCFQWQPASSAADRALIACDDRVHIIDASFPDRRMRSIVDKQLDGKGARAKITMAAWNPHHNSNVVACAVDASVDAWDIRSKQTAFTIENANISMVRFVDFNPNAQYVLATCGDDCKVSIWDIRSTHNALTTISEHSHWVWCVRFNPIHDQLLLSCSSDAKLVVYNAASVSSESGGGYDDDDDQRETERIIGDRVIDVLLEHEESVYSCDWAANEPWIYASLSYDGRVIVSRVPRNVKYQILQL